MSGSRVELNDAFFENLGHLPSIVGLTYAAALKVEARAKATAPVLTGAYRDNIMIERADTEHRVVWRVIAVEEHSMVVEARTGNLARAMNSVRI